MSDEYSDKGLERAHKQAGEWYEAFMKSPQHEALTGAERDEAPSVVQFFVEFAYNYFGVEPAGWDCGVVVECCGELMPRKVNAPLPFFQAVAPVLSAFFDFLAGKSLLPNAHALAKTVAAMGDDIVTASQERSNWGIAKSFAMAAEKAGFDLDDPEALDAFVNEYNSRLLPGISPFDVPDPGPLPAFPPPSANTVRFDQPKTGRNDPCPCGSGKKFKKCCGR